MTARRAFRLYARLGLHRKDDWSERDFYTLFGTCRGDTLRAMMAVRDTLRALHALGERECLRAVEQVYFQGRGRTPEKSEVSRRVVRFAMSHHCDERTVYRRLHRACRMYRNLTETDTEKR